MEGEMGNTFFLGRLSDLHYAKIIKFLFLVVFFSGCSVSFASANVVKKPGFFTSLAYTAGRATPYLASAGLYHWVYNRYGGGSKDWRTYLAMGALGSGLLVTNKLFDIGSTIGLGNWAYNKAGDIAGVVLSNPTVQSAMGKIGKEIAGSTEAKDTLKTVAGSGVLWENLRTLLSSMIWSKKNQQALGNILAGGLTGPIKAPFKAAASSVQEAVTRVTSSPDAEKRWYNLFTNGF